MPSFRLCISEHSNVLISTSHIEITKNARNMCGISRDCLISARKWNNMAFHCVRFFVLISRRFTIKNNDISQRSSLRRMPKCEHIVIYIRQTSSPIKERERTPRSWKVLLWDVVFFLHIVCQLEIITFSLQTHPLQVLVLMEPSVCDAGGVEAANPGRCRISLLDSWCRYDCSSSERYERCTTCRVRFDFFFVCFAFDWTGFLPLDNVHESEMEWIYLTSFVVLF